MGPAMSVELILYTYRYLNQAFRYIVDRNLIISHRYPPSFYGKSILSYCNRWLIVTHYQLTRGIEAT